MKTRLLVVAAAAANLVLYGCAAVPDDPPREQPLAPDSLGLSGPAYQAPDHWWLALDDPQLDELVQQHRADTPNSIPK